MTVYLVAKLDSGYDGVGMVVAAVAEFRQDAEEALRLVRKRRGGGEHSPRGEGWPLWAALGTPRPYRQGARGAQHPGADTMTTTIGPDGLTDEERAWRDDPAFRWMEPSEAVGRLAAERLAHAETRAARDRLREVLADPVTHIDSNGNCVVCRVPSDRHADGCIVRALLGEVKP
jgi:hypothetical protein